MKFALEITCGEKVAVMEAADRSLLDTVLRILSHELRTPLQTVLCWTRVLRTSTVDAATSAHALEVIERSTRTQAELIEDLLDVCSILTGRVCLQRVRLDLAEVLKAAVAAASPAGAAKGIRFEAGLACPTMIISADPHRMKQVLTLLLLNVIETANAYSKIAIEARHHDGPAQIKVSAIGNGGSAHRPHVCSGAEGHDGLRMGARRDLDLDIVRRLVELHGGSVKLENQRGVSVTLSLPLLEEGRNMGAPPARRTMLQAGHVVPA